jgi:hypothetical protein
VKRFSPILFGLVVGCTGGTQPQGVQPDPNPPVAPTPDPDPTPPEALPGVGTDGVGTFTPADEADPTRVRRRMTVRQLDLSLRAATGFGWDVNGDNQFEELAESLGVPDYVDRTTEDREAGLLFQKFLDDAANHVCQELVDAEFSGESDIFLLGVDPQSTRADDPAGIDAALQNAVLRFHGYSLQPTDPQLDSWRFLFDSTLTVTGGDTMAAWRAVCIGLIVHPDFYQY